MQSFNSGVPGSDWDKQLATLGGHLYQSSAWAKFQLEQDREVLYDSGQNWSWLGAIRAGRGGIKYLYCAYGPTVKGSGLKAALQSLQEAGKQYGVDFVRVEPIGTNANLAELGLKPFEDVQPQYTMLLDLNKSQEDIRRDMSQSNRNLINTAEKRGLKFRISENPAEVEEFLKIHNATAAGSGFKPHPDNYYRTLTKTLMPDTAKLYFAEFEGKAAAAAICLDWDGVRYYAFAGTYPELNRQVKAAIALLWWLIMDAKDKGLKTFDYGGVAPEDQPNHPWAGHSRFKRSVGGETIKRLGTWDLPVKPAKYQLYKMAKKVLPI